MDFEGNFSKVAINQMELRIEKVKYYEKGKRNKEDIFISKYFIHVRLKNNFMTSKNKATV